VSFVTFVVKNPFLLGVLCVLARDIPRLTGARSAPYENLRVLRAFVVNPTFLFLVAAVPREVLCDLISPAL
jgi:hypothetical protein